MEQKTAEETYNLLNNVNLSKQEAISLIQSYADQEVIKALLDFQLWLNEKNLITNHDWDFENEAKKFMKSINKK